MKMTPTWFWIQVVTFAFIIAGGVIAVVKLV